MTAYLLDTNILLRASDSRSPAYELVRDAVEMLLAQQHEVYIVPQNLIEFWAVATRPVSVNGFGWTTQQTEAEINQYSRRLRLLPDTPDIFDRWRSLVTTYDIKGKRTHDTRLVAAMLAHQVTHLLTFNTDDFSNYTEIMLIHPDTVMA